MDDESTDERASQQVARPTAPTADTFRLEALQSWCDAVPTARGRPLAVALLVLIIVFGFGGAWAATAKLGGALISSGRIIAEGNNRVVQHLEGGILAALLVREGEAVRSQQQIALLDQTQIQSQLARHYVDRALFTIALERWRAEKRDAADSFTVSAELLTPVAEHPRVVEAIESQIAEFQSSRRARRQSLLVIDGRIANEQEDLGYLASEKQALENQLTLIRTEESDLTELLEKGLTSRTRVFTLRRELSRLVAQQANVTSAIQKSHHNIRSAQDEKQRLLAEHDAETSKRITEYQQRLNQSEDTITRLNDMLRRSVITAPVDGTIVALPRKSIGAVVPAGETIAEILPADVALQIEVPILPRDVDNAFVGQHVDVVFPSDQTNVIPPLKGTVIYLSSDTLPMPDDPRMTYYVARVEMAEERHGRTVLPGNVVEVFFRTEPKTLIQIFADPITRFALRTFQE